MKSLTVFEEHLNDPGIKYIVGRVGHPQTNGSVERFYGTVKDRIDEFSSIDELIVWYNSIKPHMSLKHFVKLLKKRSTES
jgi:putative transposase